MIHSVNEIVADAMQWTRETVASVGLFRADRGISAIVVSPAISPQLNNLIS